MPSGGRSPLARGPSHQPVGPLLCGHLERGSGTEQGLEVGRRSTRGEVALRSACIPCRQRPSTPKPGARLGAEDCPTWRAQLATHGPRTPHVGSPCSSTPMADGDDRWRLNSRHTVRRPASRWAETRFTPLVDRVTGPTLTTQLRWVSRVDGNRAIARETRRDLWRVKARAVAGSGR